VFVSFEFRVDRSPNFGATGGPLTRHIAYTTACCYRTSRDYYYVFVQWNLVCDRAYLKDLTQTILIAGVMFGTIICTTLSDKFGRKPVFLFSQWAMVVVGVANTFAPNYHIFAGFRFFIGILFLVGQYVSCVLTHFERSLKKMFSKACLSSQCLR